MMTAAEGERMHKLSDAELQQVRDVLRSRLPDGNGREAWIAETGVEFERFLLLRSRGVMIAPKDGSLLKLFLELATGHHGSLPTAPEGAQIYSEAFGHAMPYVWTKTVTELTSQGALMPAPGTA